MKLKDLMTEDIKATDKFLWSFKIYADKKGSDSYLTDRDEFLDDNDKFKSDIQELVVVGTGKYGQQFNWPFGEVKLASFTVKANDRRLITLPDFKEIPSTAARYQFHNVAITSFSGVERLNEMTLLRMGEMKIECGLLRLLKCEKLNGIDCDETDRKLYAALNIIEKHLYSKDIIECQSDLIDAGLEEYAKL